MSSWLKSPLFSVQEWLFQFDVDGLLYSSFKPSVFSVLIEANRENTNCLKALSCYDTFKCCKCFNCSTIRVMTSCKYTVSFLQLFKSSSKVEVWLFGRWYGNENGVLGCLCDSALLMPFYRAQMLCALNICLFILHPLHPWEQLPFWNITVLSAAMLY